MVRHIVLWNLAEEAEGRSKAENAALLKEKLEGLCGQIDGLLKAEVTVNINPAGKEIVHKVIVSRVVHDAVI